jgi:adenylate cyclase
MTAAPAPGREFRIGDWIVDADHHELRGDDGSIRLEPKVVDVLVHLARNAGRVVGREELLSTVWPGVIVGDDALTQAIIKLRKALGDDAHNPKYIETISKAGYRLIAPVAGLPATAAGADKPVATRRRIGIAAGGIAFALVAVLLAAAVLGKFVKMPWPLAADTRGGTQSMPVVAVLPLTNLSGDPNREYFSDGVTEDIISGLGRFSAIRVMSRNAVLAFKGKAPAPHTVRSDLGAGYVVQGSVREAGGKVRVGVQLSDTDKGVVLWSERYDAEGSQLFEVQDRIARHIVGALQVKLTKLEQERVFGKPTDNMEAYDLVLRARSLLDPPERRANREARALLVRAQALAPDYPELLTTLGEAELNRARYGWVEDPQQAAARAEELAKRALAFPDPRSHPRAHSLLAAIYDYWGRLDEALSHTERAIELNPSDSEALYRRGETLVLAGRIDEAIASMEIARRLEPHAVRIYLANAYYFAGRYRDTVALADSLLERAPDHVALNAIRAAALAQMGNTEEAHRAAERVRRYSPDFRADAWGRTAIPEHNARLREGLVKAGL